MKSRQKYAMWKVTVPSITSCGHCGAAVLSHRVCSACGFYRGEFFKEPARAKKAKK